MRVLEVLPHRIPPHGSEQEARHRHDEGSCHGTRACANATITGLVRLAPSLARPNTLCRACTCATRHHVRQGAQRPTHGSDESGLHALHPLSVAPCAGLNLGARGLRLLHRQLRRAHPGGRVAWRCAQAPTRRIMEHATQLSSPLLSLGNRDVSEPVQDPLPGAVCLLRNPPLLLGATLPDLDDLHLDLRRLLLQLGDLLRRSGDAVEPIPHLQRGQREEIVLSRAILAKQMRSPCELHLGVLLEDSARHVRHLIVRRAPRPRLGHRGPPSPPSNRTPTSRTCRCTHWQPCPRAHAALGDRKFG